MNEMFNLNLILSRVLNSTLRHNATYIPAHGTETRLERELTFKEAVFNWLSCVLCI